jgi:death-on-curing protein
MRKAVWIEVRDALALHDRLLALDGGSAGVRDPGLLESALARPRNLEAYGRRPSVVDMAAAYAVGVVHDHPFVDGNKRTGFLVAVLFLEMNGYRFRASEEDATQAILDLATERIDERAFANWMGANVKRR